MKRIFAVILSVMLIALSLSEAVFAETAGEKTIVQITGSRFSINSGASQRNYYMQEHAVGSTITVTYKGSDNFRFWKDENGMTVSTDKTYTFTVLHPVILSAISTSSASGNASANVTFMTEYGQVISTRSYASSEKILFPDVPFRVGKTFIGWDHTEEEIVEGIENGEEFIVVRPMFESEDEVGISVYYQVNGTNEFQRHSSIGQGSSYLATAPETYNGQPFAYWMKGDSIISYTLSCSFFANEDTDITAVYGDFKAEEPKAGISGKVNGNYIILTANRAIDESYTLIEHGIIIVTSSEFGHDTPENRTKADSALVLNGENVKKTYVSSNNEYYGNFAINLNTNGNDRTVYAKAYITYGVREDGETVLNTVYSDMTVVSNVGN